MRLIDADAYLKKVCIYNETGCGSCVLQVKCPVDEPTVDAEPIKHGYWHILNDTDMSAVCSVCGNDTMLYYGSVVTDFEYCPCCGAKMDMARKRAVKNDIKRII